MRVRFLAVALAAALASQAALYKEARAEPEPKVAFRLEYTLGPGAESCPTRETFELMLGGDFGYPPVKATAPALVTVDVRKLSGRFVAVTRVVDPDGTERWSRTQENRRCESLLADVSLRVRIRLGPIGWGADYPPPWLAVHPYILVGPPAASPVLRVESPSLLLLAPRFYLPAVTAPDVFSRPAKPEGERSPDMQPEISAGLALSPYGMPSFSLGGSAAVTLWWGRLAIGAEMRGLVTVSDAIGDEDLPVRTILWTGSLLPCVRIEMFDICGAASVGRIVFDVLPPGVIESSDGLFLGLGGRVYWNIRLGARTFIRTYADVSVQGRRSVLGPPPNVEQGPYWTAPSMLLSMGLTFGANVGKQEDTGRRNGD